MDKITVKRIIALLDETNVNSEEDYVSLVHKIKDWNERTKAEVKSSKSSESKKKEKKLSITPELAEAMVEAAVKTLNDEANSEIDTINSELTELENPASKFEFVKERMDRVHYLRGKIHGYNEAEARIKDRFANVLNLKISNTK